MDPAKNTFLHVRVVVYSLLLLYLVVDLHFVRGPVRRSLDRAVTPEAGDLPPHARPAGRVFGKLVPLAAVDARVILDRVRAGHSPDLAALPRGLLRELRTIALDRILGELAVDGKMTVLPNIHDAVDATALVAAEEAKWGGPGALDTLLAASGMDRAAFTDHLADEAARAIYLDRLLGQARSEGEADPVAAWIREHADALTRPARLRLDHLFVATLRRDPDEVKTHVAGIRRAMLAGETTFEEAARTHSDDLSSRPRDGALGWVEVTDQRLPGGFPRTDLLAAPADGSVLPPLRTSLGWHLFRVHAREPEQRLDPAEIREAVEVHLRNQLRETALRQVLNQVEDEGEAVIFPGVLDLPPAILPPQPSVARGAPGAMLPTTDANQP